MPDDEGFETHGANLFDNVVHANTTGLGQGHHRNFGGFVFGNERRKLGLIYGIDVKRHDIKSSGSQAHHQGFTPSPSVIGIFNDDTGLHVLGFPETFFDKMLEGRTVKACVNWRGSPAFEPAFVFFRVIVNFEIDILRFATVTDMNDFVRGFGIHTSHGHR